MRHTTRSGFSIFEVVLALGMFSILVFIIVSLRGNVNTLQNLITQKLQSRQDLDVAMRQMVRDIRAAGQASNGAYPIVSASTSSLSLYSDTDADGVYEQVTYRISSTTLERGIVEPTGNPLTYATTSQTFRTHVASLATTTVNLFTYFGSDYATPLATTSTDPAAIRAVRITFYVDVRPNLAPKPTYLSQTVTVRNLRDAE